MDGKAIKSCNTPAVKAAGTSIVTVEGLIESDPSMAATAQTISSHITDVQQAFIEEGGVQCGFCTPGLIVAVHHLLDKNPDPTELQVKESISGNICRCTGYGRIFAAVEAVVQVRKASR